MLTINVIGRFRVARSDGTEITPRSRKTCGLLALLALAPRKSRTRVWLQDKLWSDRGAEQAAGSLRQSLSEIRIAFGADRAALLSDRTVIGLDPNAVSVDIDDLPYALAALAGTVGTPELLEGFDVRDQEFEDWLRLARRIFADKVAAHRAEPAVQRVDARPPRPRLVVTTDAHSEGTDRAQADFFAHRIAASIRVQPPNGPIEGVQASAAVTPVFCLIWCLRCPDH